MPVATIDSLVDSLTVSGKGPITIHRKALRIVHRYVHSGLYPLALLGKGKGGSLPRVCNLNSISTNETLFIFTCDLAGTVS